MEGARLEWRRRNAETSDDDLGRGGGGDPSITVAFSTLSRGIIIRNECKRNGPRKWKHFHRQGEVELLPLPSTIIGHCTAKTKPSRDGEVWILMACAEMPIYVRALEHVGFLPESLPTLSGCVLNESRRKLITQSRLSKLPEARVT